MDVGAQGTIDRVSLDGKTIDRFPISITDPVNPAYVSPGSDGNVWFTEINATRHNIGRVTPDGTITEFHVADTNASTNVIATGADGDLWFTEAGNFDGDIWRVHPNGALVGTSIPVHYPIGLALGPDGNMWFAARLDGEIGKLHSAPANRSFVLEIASGFTPAVRTVPLGRMVEWVMEAPGMHRVRDATGLGLYDSGPVAPVSFSMFRFPAAGRYPYLDGPGGRRGTVLVTIDAPATGHVGTPIHLAWATAGAPDGSEFDVQIRRPGEAFGDFRSETATHGASFTPSVAGVYRFRSRMHGATGEAGTDFSPVRTIHVS
jgi:plastocyanin